MEYYQFIAVMDNRTTPMCQQLDGEIFPLVELNQGENAPPMHVRCRSTICASIEGIGKRGERAARDDAGRRIKVPAEMTYKDWKATYIDNKEIAKLKRERNERILAKLEKTREEVGLKGKILYPPPQFDLSKFVFDIEHAQSGKHPHNVTEEEARSFIKNAYFAIYSLKAESYNYYGKNGGAFVQMNSKKIRTAFKSDEYNPKILRLIEAFEDEIGKI